MPGTPQTVTLSLLGLLLLSPAWAAAHGNLHPAAQARAHGQTSRPAPPVHPAPRWTPPRRIAVEWTPPVSRGYASTTLAPVWTSAPVVQAAVPQTVSYAPSYMGTAGYATEVPMSLNQALAAFQRRDYATALIGFRYYAEQGSAVAQNHLGAMYQEGLGVPIDLPQAAAWYLKSASQGNANGQYRVGRLYEQGLGVPANLALARYWYRMASDQGQLAALYSLRRVEGPPAGVTPGQASGSAAERTDLPTTAIAAPITPPQTAPVAGNPPTSPAPAQARPVAGTVLPASAEPSATLAVQEQAPLAPAPGRRLALVIGNASYHRGVLKNPLHDADDMTRALRLSGFSVIELRDANLQQMRSAIRLFGDRMAHQDVGLVYYSGHGVEIQGRNYFIPINADIQREDEVVDQSLDVELILDKMRSAQKGVNILIVDACRDNPFGREFRTSGAGLGSMEPPSGTLIAYSTSPGKVAADGDGRNSPFTGQLLRVMQEPNKPIEQVFKEVRRAVQLETHNLQTPWETTSLSGDFFFHVQGQRVAMP